MASHQIAPGVIRPGFLYIPNVPPPPPCEFKEGRLYDALTSAGVGLWVGDLVPRFPPGGLPHQIVRSVSDPHVYFPWSAVQDNSVPHMYQIGDRLRLKASAPPSRRSQVEKWRQASGTIVLDAVIRPLTDSECLWKVSADPQIEGVKAFDIPETTRPGYVYALSDHEHVVKLAKSTRPRNHTCTCGSPAFQVFMTVECESPTCRWYKS